MFKDKSNYTQVAIAGGGLSGLLLAYLLQKQDISCMVFEAAPRLGGRIQTINTPSGIPLELGATWLSDAHPRLKNLLAELGLSVFPQHTEGLSLFHAKAFVPPQQFYIQQSDPPSYRIAGGSSALIEKIVSSLHWGSVHTGKKVIAIGELGQNVNITLETGETYHCKSVAVCMPPKLMAQTISLTPQLPVDVNDTLNAVHTWMAGSTKFVVEYQKPFWREKGFSGVLYSHTGLVTEMYEQNDAKGERFAFAGFLGSSAALYDQQQRKEIVLNQLAQYFGEEAKNVTYYNDKVWVGDFITADGPPTERPHQNNGHPHLESTYMGGKLLFSGSETSDSHPGYMEGAVTAAETGAKKIATFLTKNVF